MGCIAELGPAHYLRREKPPRGGARQRTQSSPRGHPKLFFARVDTVVNKMRLVGVEETAEQIVEIMIDRLPPRFRVRKVILRCKPVTTKQMVEETIANAYA